MKRAATNMSWFAPIPIASEASDTMRGRMLRVWFIVSSCVRNFFANDEFLWASALT